MDSLGTRIKNHRKRLGLTLKQMAGDELSYSMLSQIENDKAKPSLGTLELLAKKFSIDISELMGGAEISHLRTILKEAEALSFSPYERNQNNDIKLLALIEPLLPSLVETNYETARLLDLYARSQFHVYNILDDTHLFSAIHMYEQLNMNASAIASYLHLSKSHYQQLDYEHAYYVLKKAEEKLNEANLSVDLLSKWEFYSYATAINFAIGDVNKGKQYLDECLELSYAHNLYYQVDRLYRLKIIQALQENDKTTGTNFLDKLNQYVKFTHNPYEKSHAMYLECHYLNRISDEYEEVLNRLTQYKMDMSKECKEMTLTVLFDYEISYSLWGLERYEEALEVINNIQIPSYVKHPYDLSACYEAFAIRALCNFQLGNKEAAYEDIVLSYQKVKKMPITIYQSFIESSYKKIFHH